VSGLFDALEAADLPPAVLTREVPPCALIEGAVPPGPCSAWPAQVIVENTDDGSGMTDTELRAVLLAGPRYGYSIQAEHPTENDGEGAGSYTEAPDDRVALVRARKQFPPAEGWTGHAVRRVEAAR
jgi:hypothetical protein